MRTEQNAPQLRQFLVAPPPQLVDAARFLDAAVSAHLTGDSILAEQLIRAADMPAIYAYLKPVWSIAEVHLRVPRESCEPSIPKELRVKARAPTLSERLKIHARDGYNCRFCGLPVIRPEIRARISRAYPNAARWGRKESEQHAALQAMWAQYDHVLPHSRGGTNELENIVLACAACNFGRAGYSLKEVGVQDPRERPIVLTAWDGLERFRS